MTANRNRARRRQKESALLNWLTTYSYSLKHYQELLCQLLSLKMSLILSNDWGEMWRILAYPTQSGDVNHTGQGLLVTYTYWITYTSFRRLADLLRQFFSGTKGAPKHCPNAPISPNVLLSFQTNPDRDSVVHPIVPGTAFDANPRAHLLPFRG